jgi:hypothetical protein
MLAAHASLGVHRWICPQARHGKGTPTFGSVSRTIISVVRPVGTGRFVCGHLITMSLTATPLNRKYQDLKGGPMRRREFIRSSAARRSRDRLRRVGSSQRCPWLGGNVLVGVKMLA